MYLLKYKYTCAVLGGLFAMGVVLIKLERWLTYWIIYWIDTIKDLSIIHSIGWLLILGAGIGSIIVIIQNLLLGDDKESYGIQERFRDRKLLPKREKDLKEIEQRVENFPIVGIDAEWGMGKSILTEKLLVNLSQKNWNIIQIDALRFSTENLSRVMLSELQALLWKKNKIVINVYGVLGEVRFPWYLEGIARFFGLTDSPTMRLEKSAGELNTIKETTIINYEDIDRITDTNTLKQLLAVNELLVRKVRKLKIIYQYSDNRLRQLGLEQEYLEKYIPQTISLSKLGFLEVVGQVLSKKSEMKFSFNKELEEMVGEYTIGSAMDGVLAGMEIRLPKMYPPIYPYRKVEAFIDEVYSVMRDNRDYKGKKCKIALKVLFLKHFIPQLYSLFRQLGPGINHCQSIFLYDMGNGDSVTLDVLLTSWEKLCPGEIQPDMSDFYSKLNEILLKKKNLEIYNLLNFLGYSQGGKSRKREDKITDEEIDRVVCHIVAPAVSPRTDVEEMYLRLKSIFKNEKYTKQRWEKILEMFGQYYMVDAETGENQTIQMIGEAAFEALIRKVPYILERYKEENEDTHNIRKFRVALLCCFLYHLRKEKNKLSREKSAEMVLAAFSAYTCMCDDEIKIISIIYRGFCTGVEKNIKLYVNFLESIKRSLTTLWYLDGEGLEGYSNSANNILCENDENKKALIEEALHYLERMPHLIQRREQEIIVIYPERRKSIQRSYIYAKHLVDACIEDLKRDTLGYYECPKIDVKYHTAYDIDLIDIIKYIEEHGWEEGKRLIYEQYDQKKLGLRGLYGLRNYKDSVKQKKE